MGCLAEKRLSSQIHPTAIIHENAQLGIEVEVGPYSVIGPHVVIGDQTRIASHVVVEGRTTFGPENVLYQFASVGAAPQDLKYQGEPSELIIGARNIIREYVTLQPGTEDGTMKTVIGDGNLFMANSHVGHDCRIGDNNVLSNSVGLGGHVTIENSVILGGLVGVHQFCRLGDYAILGAGCMTGSDIPPFCIGQGDRCHLRGINVIGLERAGFSEEDIREIRRAYRILFSTVGHVKEKLDSFPPELAVRPLVQQMLEFIKGTSRGICSPFKSLS